MSVKYDHIGEAGFRPTTVEALIKELRPSFTEADLAEALIERLRTPDTVGLTAAEQEAWERYSGISADPHEVALASASNAAAKLSQDITAFTAADVAMMLGLSASTVRHYRAERKLYSYLTNGRVLFPAWQFAKNRPLPHLDRVLAALPDDLHPQTVAGFFKTRQPELTLKDGAVTVAEWLLSGGSPERVVKLAAGLGTAL